MTENQSIIINPIGVIRSDMINPEDAPFPGRPAEVEVFPQYSSALLRVEENSHLWLMLWFHKSDRHCLTSVPRRVNAGLPEYGAFGLRSPNRPNPIALCLVHLDSINGNILQVHGLDAIDGTPLLDIKPYYEQDIVFSPTTPYIRAFNPVLRREIFFKEALNHHQEECPSLYMAVRMALVADEFMGHLNSPDLKLTVSGSACLADTLQGLSRARLANPPRFTYQETNTASCSLWEKSGRSLSITARCELSSDTYRELTDEELFIIKLEES